MAWYSTPFGLVDTDLEQLQTWGVADQSTLVPTYQTPGGETYQFAPELVGREGYQAPGGDPTAGFSWFLGTENPQDAYQQRRLQELQSTYGAIPARDWRRLVPPGEATSATERQHLLAATDPDLIPTLNAMQQAAQGGDARAQDMLNQYRAELYQASYAATAKQDPWSPFGDEFFTALLGLAIAGGGAVAMNPALLSGAAPAAGAGAAGAETLAAPLPAVTGEGALAAAGAAPEYAVIGAGYGGLPAGFGAVTPDVLASGNLAGAAGAAGAAGLPAGTASWVTPELAAELQAAGVALPQAGGPVAGGGSWLSTLLTPEVMTTLGTAGGGGGLLGTLGDIAKGAGTVAGITNPDGSINWGGLLSTLAGAGTGIAQGALGSSAATSAAQAQADALRDALAFSREQWQTQQANLAPWLQTGQRALGTLEGLVGQGPSAAFTGWDAPVSGEGFRPPSATPGWTPASYTGPAPVAAEPYRYTPGAVPTLSGRELLANDPGYQFRQDEARRALEASQAARGGLYSGPAMRALLARSQELASGEYANAWTRARDQAALREAWAQEASRLGFGHALSAQQTAWEQGLKGQQWSQGQQQAWDEALRAREMENLRLRYGQDVYANEQQYARELAEYNSRTAQETQWRNLLSTLAGYGQTATGTAVQGSQAAATQVGNILAGLGTAQASGTAGAAQSWLEALRGIGTQATQTGANWSLLQALNA